jgi:hypothetical protein
VQFIALGTQPAGAAPRVGEAKGLSATPAVEAVLTTLSRVYGRGGQPTTSPTNHKTATMGVLVG